MVVASGHHLVESPLPLAGSSMASSSLRCPGTPPPRGPCRRAGGGPATAKSGALKLPPAMACAPEAVPLAQDDGPDGTVRLAPVTNNQPTCPPRRSPAPHRPDHDPRVSHRNRIGTSNASHSCRNRAALSAASASMAPASCVGSFATTPTATLEPCQGRDHPQTEPARSSSTEPTSAIASTTARTS